MNEQTFLVHPVAALSGVVRVPGDKSISHRAIMLGALADGITRVKGFLLGADALATAKAFQAMGVVIDLPAHQGSKTAADAEVVIHGVGVQGLQDPQHALDCGNSGTAMRLLAGLLSGANRRADLVGDHSLSQRPMRRVMTPLLAMGAAITATPEGTPPLRLQHHQGLTGIDYVLPVASAQVKSAILLAGLYADGETRVVEPAPTRDHSERMLSAMGVEVIDTALPDKGEGVRAISLRGGQRLRSTAIDVPADIPSAAFFMVAASIAEQADITLLHVGMNPTRTGCVEILRLMGADIEVLHPREVGGEPVADIRVRSAPLRGITIPEHLVPLAIDEFPVLFVAAANAQGTTTLTGAEELRVKESDRIAVMATGLQACGIDAKPTPDGMVIEGQAGPDKRYHGAEIFSHGDHRIAMAFTVAALRARSNMTIRGCEFIATSFPGFVELARTLGFVLDVQEAKP